MERRRELADFLRSRRHRLSPGQVGLPLGTRRRTPGLRREEVAELARLSVDYYVRLEQGRDIHPSLDVLERLAESLCLTDDERSHLFELASLGMPAVRTSGRGVASAGIGHLVELISPLPALVLDSRMNVLCWNHAMRALIIDFEKVPPERRNMVWLSFMEPSVKSLYVDWERVARESIAHLRAASTRIPDDIALAHLVGELVLKSPDFARWWALHDVKEKGSGYKQLDHSQVGRLNLNYEVLALIDDPDQRLVVYMAADEVSRAKLQELSQSIEAETDRSRLKVLPA
jgi:transcriptional regulator with XRE-family HTH domain